MMPSFIVFHPLQLPAMRDLSHTSAKGLPGTTDYSKAEYTNTQQDLPGDSYITDSRHERFFGHWGFLLLKNNKEYVLTFKILAQVLVDYSFLS
jgi:hypothetical protein